MNDMPINVLVVDDEECIVRALSRLLKPRYKVFQAESGEEALEIIRSNPIHVIVSDQRMPNMTGSELLTKVKLISPNTTRILLTGYSDLSAVMDSVNQGEIFRYITKPWLNEDFLTTVSQASEIALSLFKTTSTIVGKKPAKKLLAKEGAIPVVRKKILVLDKEGELNQTLSQVLNDKADCLLAHSLKDASRILLEKDISLIAMNISLDDREALAFIKIVKAKKPNILCLVAADSADITHITSLINEGQIYRFITKPLRKGQLKMYIHSALCYCRQLADKPELLARHKVENISNAEEQLLASTFNLMWKSLRQSLRRLVT